MLSGWDRSWCGACWIGVPAERRQHTANSRKRFGQECRGLLWIWRLRPAELEYVPIAHEVHHLRKSLSKTRDTHVNAEEARTPTLRESFAARCFPERDATILAFPEYHDQTPDRTLDHCAQNLNGSVCLRTMVLLLRIVYECVSCARAAGSACTWVLTTSETKLELTVVLGMMR